MSEDATVTTRRDDSAPDALWRSFIDPPDEARPRAWWHWMDGNIDPAGIDRDLRWMHEVGLRGAQVFEGGMGGPLLLDEAVRPGSATWDRAVATAVRTSAELGMELAVATSSGWSASGAPWVAPRDAMKKLVWAESIVSGGTRVRVDLPALPSCAGSFQDARLGGSDGLSPFAVSWRVLALPADARNIPQRPDAVTASTAADVDATVLCDASFDAGVHLPRDPDAWSTAWLEQRFSDPVTVRSVVLGLPNPTGFGAAPAPNAVLEASDDGVDYREVVRIEPSPVPARTASFPPVTARRFRLTLSAASAAEALPAQGEGVAPAPVLRRADRFTVTQFALREGGLVHSAEAKAGFTAAPDYYALDTPAAAAGAGAIDPASVIDLTAEVHDGTLDWDAPPGQWRILHLGASLTGKTNGPALPDATGLEVDKLDRARVAAYLNRHLAAYAGAGGFAALLSDSIESGAQNWTERIADHFRARRGYDPTPYLPALTGLLVGDAVVSDRFLYDYRRTIAELYADEYYGTLAAEAHRRGMRLYAEALEDGRPQLGDDLAMRAHADIPMGAMWAFDPLTGPRPTYVADLKGAASVAHVHGRAHTGSEAFTAFTTPWSFTPQRLKHVADLQFALGVTRMCIHTSAHQPLGTPPPGVSLAPFLGQTFTANETWAGMARPWIDYLARCSAMLSAGEPDVSVAVFVGEEAPVTGLHAGGADRTLPPGTDFDYVGPDALHSILQVDGGTIRSRGASYRALVLGGSAGRMTLRALTDLERLVDAGALVIGARPSCSPSLADDAAEVAAACDRLWGAGRVVEGEVGPALRAHGIHPAVSVDEPDVRVIGRRTATGRLTFLANPSSHATRVTVRTTDAGPLAIWDPVRVERYPLVRDANGSIEVALAPFGSAFLVSGVLASGISGSGAAVPIPAVLTELNGPWTLQLPGGAPRTVGSAPVDWTTLGVAERGFSGVAVFRTEVEVDLREDERIELDLAHVHGIAEVVVNGIPCGVMWTAPYRIDVTAALCAGDTLRSGVNAVELHVATPWRNRLIAEAARPSGEMLAPVTRVYLPTADPMPAGAEGPVRLLRRPISTMKVEHKR